MGSGSREAAESSVLGHNPVSEYLKNLTYFKIPDLPGQSDKLQGIVCLSEPTQLSPPNLGGGLSHLRMRSLLPGPHLTEQKLHMFHEPQFP